MAWQWVPHIIPLLIATATLTALAIYAWQHRPAPGTTPFVFLTLAAAEWSLGYALELGSTSLPAKLFWIKAEYVGIVAVPVAWLMFALQYTGREKWLTPRNVVLVWTIPLFVLSLVWTNEIHHLFYVDSQLDVRGWYTSIDLTYGPAFWVHMTYSYALLALGIYLLARTVAHVPGLYRGQTIALLVGVLTPCLVNLGSVLAAQFLPRLDTSLDFTPFSFTITGLAVIWGLYRFRLLDIMPLARAKIVESISEGVIVLDGRNRIVDLNPAACRIFGRPVSDAIGRPFSELLPFSADLLRESRNGTEISIDGQTQRSFDLHVSLLHDHHDRLLGRVLLLHDLTDRKRAEEVLLRRNRELALFNHVGQAFTSTLHLDQVFTTVLEEVRRLLNVVICSIWLYDPTTGKLVCQQSSGPKSEMVRGWSLYPGQGLTGWVYENGRCLLVSDTRAEERHFKGVDERTGWELRSILSVPLRIKDKVIGTLDATDTEVGRFTLSDLSLVESLAATAAIAIENARLYDQACQDAETKAVLLDEVNHRVKNNLTAILGLLYAEKNHTWTDCQDRYQVVMQDLIGRIQGLATVHQLLSESEWSPLRLGELVSQVVDSSLQAFPLSGKTVLVNITPCEVQVSAEQANCLALITNEIVTNTCKYALEERPSARLDIHITHEKDMVCLEFWDDGPGYPAEVLRGECYNVGLNLLRSLVRSELRGVLTLRNEKGAATMVQFRADTE